MKDRLVLATSKGRCLFVRHLAGQDIGFGIGECIDIAHHAPPGIVRLGNAGYHQYLAGMSLVRHTCRRIRVLDMKAQDRGIGLAGGVEPPLHLFADMVEWPECLEGAIDDISGDRSEEHRLAYVAFLEVERIGLVTLAFQ